MPKRIVQLSEMQVRNVKPQEKQTTLFDGGGLYLLITPTGGKLWRFKYSLFGKEKLLALGSYPEISLAAARQRREDARKQVANGIDPGDVKKAKKASFDENAENSFEVVAREWHKKFLKDKSDSYRDKMMANFERDVFPWLGKVAVNILKPPELLTVLNRIEDRGALETAHRTRSACSQVLRYAVATGRAERDCAADLIGALPSYNKGHRAALTDPKTVAPLLRAIDGYLGTFSVKCALKLAPLLFVRPGELRRAEWSEVDFDAAEWRIPGSKMKMKNDHIVPLASQSLVILKDLYPLTGHFKFLFPSPRSPLKPMSDNAVLSALRRMGFEKNEMSGHGFRAMARTILDEVLHVRTDFIEHQLAHAVKDPNGRAYNRTAHLDERRKMMQVWADYLDELKQSIK